MQTRREIIKGGLGLAGIIAAGKAPAALVRSLIAARAALTGVSRRSPSYWGLCFTAEGSGATISMVATGSPPTLHLYTSKDTTNWTSFIPGTDSITLANVGDKVWFKGGTLSDGTRNVSTATSSTAYWKFTISNAFVSASGNIMSLYDGDVGYTLYIPQYGFHSLFRGCSNLTEPPDLYGSALTGTQPYGQIFRECSNLRHIAKMPQNVIVSGIIGAYMYGYCTNLTSVDMSGTIFSGTIASSGIGGSVFSNCSNLKYVKPSLIKIGASTFNSCSSLEVIDFRHATSVIELANTSVFNNTNNTYKIVVPDSLYSSWIVATYWNEASIVSHIVKASDYVEA